MARGADSSAPDSAPPPKAPAPRRRKALTLRAAQAPEKQRQESTLHLRERSSGRPRQVPAAEAPYSHRSARRRAATALCSARPRALVPEPRHSLIPALSRRPAPRPAPPGPAPAWAVLTCAPPRPSGVAGGGESLPVVCFFPSPSLVRYPA